MNKKICIVDDDKKIIELIKKYLSKNGFTNVSSMTGKELTELNRIDFDLIILDVMMPDIDGFEVCKILRKKTDAFIIFLSAKDEIFDKIIGLEIGGDDYITKPFEPRELIARINSLFRREKNSRDQNYHEGRFEFAEFIFDMDRQIIIKNEKNINLTTYEYLLLKYFCNNINIVLSRKQIIEYLEQNDFYSYDRSVDIGISRLRKKIEIDPKSPLCLKTVWGRGYQFVLQKEN